VARARAVVIGAVSRPSGAPVRRVHHLAAAHRFRDRAAADGGKLGARHRLRRHAAVRVYCYAAAPADPGARAGDERAELIRLFGTWHEPIPALLEITRPQDVLRHDAAELAAGTEPGQVAGMLARYTAARRPRTTDAVCWSRRAATMTTWDITSRRRPPRHG
jgi:hypothetical protein